MIDLDTYFKNLGGKKGRELVVLACHILLKRGEKEESVVLNFCFYN